MAIKTLNPTTPGQRGMTTRDFSEVTETNPVRSLLIIKKITAGRNNQGRITTRHKGSGVKRFIRNVNFNLEAGTKAVVEAIEYDPGRSAHIARIKDESNPPCHSSLTHVNRFTASSIANPIFAIASGMRQTLKLKALKNHQVAS